MEFFSLVHGSLVISGMNIIVATLCALCCIRIVRKTTKPQFRSWSLLVGFASFGYVFNEFRQIGIILSDVRAGVAVNAIDEFTWSALDWCWLTGSMLLARDHLLRECRNSAEAKQADTLRT